MDRYKDFQEDEDEVLVELEVDDGKELDFGDRIRQFEEHTFEDDFDRELPELEPDIEPEPELLSEEDVEMLQMDKDYEAWLDKK